MARIQGRLSKVLISPDAVTTDYVEIKGMKEGSFNGSRSEIKVTAHDDGDFENYITGRIDGTVDLKLYYDEADPGQQQLVAAWLAGTVVYAKYITHPGSPAAQVDTLAVNTVTVGHAYPVTINGVTYTYTAIGGDTQQSILTALSALIVATAPVTGAVTGTGITALLTLTGTVIDSLITYTAVDALLTRANTVVPRSGKEYSGTAIITKHEEAGGDNDAMVLNTTMRLLGAFVNQNQSPAAAIDQLPA
jgi:hypothetical protein